MRTSNYILRKGTQCNTKNKLIGQKRPHFFAAVLVRFVVVVDVVADDEIKPCIRYLIT